jgi:XTP/dITP diphosphohydrolase
MKKVYFITSNKGKLLEAKTRLSEVGIEVAQKNLGYPEIQAETLEEVARYGVKSVRERFNEAFILEDAGLFIKSLKGFPGVYSSYVFFTVGLDGILGLMNRLEQEKRKASFKSVFAFSEPDKEPVLFIGECKGIISKEKKGTHGFGYDPIFIAEGETKTFAEMETREKNRYSHRGRSLDLLVNYFKKR